MANEIKSTSMVNVEKLMCKTNEEWSIARKDGIGGSDIPTLLGCNPYLSINEWFEIRMGRKESSAETNAMRMGHVLEPYIAESFAKMHPNLILDDTSVGNYILVDSEHPWRRVSPDREFIDHKGYRVLLECKSSHSWLDNQLATDGINEYWLLQTTWQMGISGIHKAYIAFMDTPRYTNCTIGELELDFCSDLYNLECEIADKVWHENLCKNIAPSEICLREQVRDLAKEVIEKAKEPYARAKAEADAEKARKKEEKKKNKV